LAQGVYDVLPTCLKSCRFTTKLLQQRQLTSRPVVTSVAEDAEEIELKMKTVSDREAEQDQHFNMLEQDWSGYYGRKTSKTP